MESGPEAAGGGPGADPVGIALALGAAAQNERVAAKAEPFPEKQADLSDRHWGKTLLHRSNCDAAIEQFREASKKATGSLLRSAR